jgi:hypothetical protein
MTETLAGVDLQTVTAYRPKDNANLEKENYAFASSMQTRIYDYSGMDRTITLKGVAYFTSTASLMDDFVVKIRALQNGNQTAVIYHSDLEDAATTGDYTNGNIYVKVNSFEFEYLPGEVTKISYTIELWEGQ